MAGDFKDSSVFDAMKKNGCNYRIALGDMGYANDLSLVKKIAPDRAVCGNHDTQEDGNSNIEKECLAYTGDHWSLKIGTASLILGLNTNGDPSTQISFVSSTISQNPQVKTVILLSHKGGHVPPNSHHPAEAANLYASLEKLVPSGVRLVEVFGHNHVSSSAPSKNWYQAGAGGKSFYSCGTDAIWTYCDNKKVGYLELTISNTDGATAAKFIN